MKLNSRFWRIATAVLCVFLIITHASAVFLPHDHDSCDEECVACAIIRESNTLFAGLAIVTSLLGLDFIEGLISGISPLILSIIKNTPVKLRVKLLN